MAQPALAQGEVLAIRTPRLAVAKEDRTRTASPADRRFLASMHVPGGDNRLGAGVTDASLPRDAVALAVLRANGATPQDFPGGCRPLSQFARFIQIEVARI